MRKSKSINQMLLFAQQLLPINEICKIMNTISQPLVQNVFTDFVLWHGALSFIKSRHFQNITHPIEISDKY